jgi:SAM-dependent methyltransferase
MLSLQELRDEILNAAGDSALLYDLGCGQSPMDGFRGIDFFATGEGIENIDLYSYPWPFADESVDYFRSSHFLEHVENWDEHFAQIYRCLKPGGHYEIVAPYYLNNRWFQDPDHKQPILQERFAYLSSEWRRINKIDHYGAKVNFDMIGWFELLHEDFRSGGFSEDMLAWHKTHSWNVIDDIATVLRKEAIA